MVLGEQVKNLAGMTAAKAAHSSSFVHPTFLFSRQTHRRDVLLCFVTVGHVLALARTSELKWYVLPPGRSFKPQTAQSTLTKTTSSMFHRSCARLGSQGSDKLAGICHLRKK